MSIERAYEILLWFSAIALAILACACFARAVLGPRFTDRIIAINVICTKAVVMIAIFSLLMEESGLLDIAIIYAMIGFLAVVVLSKCYIIPHTDRPFHVYHSEALQKPEQIENVPDSDLSRI